MHVPACVVVQPHTDEAKKSIQNYTMMVVPVYVVIMINSKSSQE